MVGISFWRVMRAAFQNFWRNIWLSLATTVIMVITLLMMAFLYFANVFGGQVLNNIEQKVDVSVTFKQEVSPDYVQALAKELESRADVDRVSIVTSEEALEDFRQRHKDDPFIEESLKQLNENPLSASIRIVATDPQFYADIAKQLEAEKYKPYIEKVNFDKSRVVIDKLISIIGTVKQVGLALTVIFAVLVILIMFNTVRLAIYSFREEIDIMRLVGASRWFIQGPFLIESVAVALLAAAVSIIILYLTLNSASSQLQRFFFDQSGSAFDIYTYATTHWLTIIGLQLGVAVALAVFSSLIGIRRYLRE